MVDGAQAFGQVQLALDELRFDYYIGNFHKWVGAIRASSILIAKKGFPVEYRGLVVGRGDDFQVDRPLIIRETNWIGLHDPVAVLSVPFCIEENNRLFGLDAMDTCAIGLKEGLNCLQEVLGDKIEIENTPIASMTTIIVRQSREVSIASVRNRLSQHQCWASVWPIEAPNKFRLRLCHYHYNELSDYVRLSDALLEIAR